MMKELLDERLQSSTSLTTGNVPTYNQMIIHAADPVEGDHVQMQANCTPVRGIVNRNNAEKSLSDTTIYAPVILKENESMAPVVVGGSHEIYEGSSQIIQEISDFVGNARANVEATERIEQEEPPARNIKTTGNG